ncbi:DUF317 domain-containing protein [Streptomyces sp. NPDC003247]|uniref:DUF317 domain-containing protein n=1 Tax=Streptomyces sp. NPDC003247 TaxID=3364677 RepID=UPI0036A4BAAD
MPVSERQLAEFADKHAWQIPFDTSPRHLAGPGDARHVTHGLSAAGWTRTSDPLNPQMVLTSPGNRHHLHFTPGPGYLSTWWQLSSEPFGDKPYWYAAFGELVPAEILASVTDALTAPPPAIQPDPWRTVDAAGWIRPDTGTAHSVDGMCFIEQRQRDSRDAPYWSVETRETDLDGNPGRILWHASFHDNTPTHLVHAFVTALTDTDPLQRGMHDRTAHYNAVQEPSPLTPQQVVDAHTTRLKTISTQAPAARRLQRLSTTKPPAPPSTSAPLQR